jgi:thiol-disulfide isomerase/thioredoxin
VEFKLKYIITFYLLVLTSCYSENEQLGNVKLHDLDGNSVKAWNKDVAVTVFVFMAPDCPLCINYSLAIRELENEFKDESFKVNLIFPGEIYSNNEISTFLLDHNLKSTTLIDKNYDIVRLMEATVTPEAILVNNQGVIKYKGAIDDWVYGTGLRKQLVTKTYLKDAINAVLHGKEPAQDYIRAYGCYIELL